MGLGILFVTVNNANAGIIECSKALDEGEGCKSDVSICYYTLKETGQKCIITESDFGRPGEEEGDITE